MYEKTITLFNRRRRNGTDTWYPTVISNVDLNVDAAAIRKAYGAESNDRAKLHIRYSDNLVGGKTYYLPKDWDGEGVTFHDGELFDFFWMGEWSGNSPIADEDYTSGFYDYMRKNNDMVFAITSVARYDCIPHFEIMGA